MRQAILNTFKKREFSGNVEDLMKVINESDVLRNRWKAFSKYNKYAKNIKFDEILECLEKNSWNNRIC